MQATFMQKCREASKYFAEIYRDKEIELRGIDYSFGDDDLDIFSVQVSPKVFKENLSDMRDDWKFKMSAGDLIVWYEEKLGEEKLQIATVVRTGENWSYFYDIYKKSCI